MDQRNYLFKLRIVLVVYTFHPQQTQDRGFSSCRSVKFKVARRKGRQSGYTVVSVACCALSLSVSPRSHGKNCLLTIDEHFVIYFNEIFHFYVYLFDKFQNLIRYFHVLWNLLPKHSVHEQYVRLNLHLLMLYKRHCSFWIFICLTFYYTDCTWAYQKWLKLNKI